MTQERTFDFEEAKQIGDALGVDWNMFAVEQFRQGLGVEMEHGSRNANTDVTHDDLLQTGRIVWAHLRNIPDYYTRLGKMEKEAAKHWGRELSLPRRGRSR